MANNNNNAISTVTTPLTESVIQVLVKKVFHLLEMEWCTLSGLHEGIDYLRNERSSMHALLDRLDGLEEDLLNRQVREWRDAMRKLWGDIDSCIGDFARRIDAADGGQHQGGGGNAVGAFFKRNTRKVATAGARHKIGNKIKKLKARINHLNERRKKYKIDGLITLYNGPEEYTCV